MSNAPARLIVQQSLYNEREYELIHLQTTIGRSPDTDIPIIDPEVSRRHAQILHQDEVYTIIDLGSTNGTFVNQERVTGRTALQHGDIINLGDAITLRFVNPTSQATTPDLGRPSLEDTPTVVEMDVDTPVTLPPSPPPAYAAPPPFPGGEPETAMADDTSDRRRFWLGCGCGFLMLLFACVGLLWFLDGYQEGRLLYCGVLRPFWDSFLTLLDLVPNCP